ncbi:MAG: imidazole glycerol phosphate synthase subunit HisF [Endomicrobiia bacterium]
MYTVRVIPCLDVKDGKVVKGVKFKNLQYAGDPVKLAKRYSEEGADEIVFLDITATIEKRRAIFDVVTKAAENVFVPLTVGGGIRTVEDVREMLNAGADKVAINSAAVKSPDFIKEAAKQFGSQCIVVAIDAKRQLKVKSVKCKEEQLSNFNFKSSLNHKWEVYINAGRTSTGLDVIEWAKKVEQLGAGEILLTSIDADGTKEGYDIELTKAVVNAVSIPVIASGGAGKIEHMIDVVKKTNVSAVLAASIFHYNKFAIKKVKGGLKSCKIPVRV